MVAQYQPVLHTTAERELESLPDSDQDRLTKMIKEVCEYREPTQHSRVRHLEGQEGLFRLREGGVRAILALSKPNVIVVKVGERDSVYDDIDSVSERLEPA